MATGFTADHHSNCFPVQKDKLIYVYLSSLIYASTRPRLGRVIFKRTKDT